MSADSTEGDSVSPASAKSVFGFSRLRSRTSVASRAIPPRRPAPRPGGHGLGGVVCVGLREREGREIGGGGAAAARGAGSEGGCDDDDRDARPGAPHRARMLADPARRRLLPGERRQELHGATLGPRPDTPGPAASGEPDVAAAGRELSVIPPEPDG